MNIRKHATKIVAAGLALAVAVLTVAMAAHPFTDVPDGQWYSDAVDWAYDNELTTGKTPTTFNGFDNTNRYEVVTFFNRYHDNMVAPELSDIRGEVRDTVHMQFDMFDSDDNAAGQAIDNNQTALDVSNTVTIPEGYKGVIEVAFSGESACYGAGVFNWCEVNLYVDGEEISLVGQAFDSTDDGSEGAFSWEGHIVRAVSPELDAGTYTITATGQTSSVSVSFSIADTILTSQVHLTDTADLGFVTLGE